MTIRTRLLALLLPTLVFFLFLISLFFFFNWNEEINESFKANLRSIVVSVAEMINSKEIAWINEHRTDSNLTGTQAYKSNEALLKRLKEKLPVIGLYVVSIEPVKKGERVLLDRPLSDTNKIYDGASEENAYRQVYLLDTSADIPLPLRQDFSESNEHSVYFTKKAIVTPIYQGKGSNLEFMSGYAPIMNSKGDVVALIGADVNLNIVNRIAKHALLVMIGATFFAILLMTLAVIFIANKITEPVSQLKNAALALAAGDYEEKINIKGPKEIAELANTFNTMRECLLDYINRLKASSFAKEKLLGEENSAILIQNRMLDGVIERIKDPGITLRHIAPSQPMMTKAMMLDAEEEEKGIAIVFKESKSQGFEGVFSLLSNPDDVLGSVRLKVFYDRDEIEIENENMPLPFIWRTSENRFIATAEKKLAFQKGDIALLFNQELAHLFPHLQIVQDWTAKVLRQFAKEPEGLLTAMLTAELNFWIKKQLNPRSVHIILIKKN